MFHALPVKPPHQIAYLVLLVEFSYLLVTACQAPTIMALLACLAIINASLAINKAAQYALKTEL